MVRGVQAIKDQNPIEEVVARHGVSLRRQGRRLVGRCPFHEDQHPSFVVYPETSSFYCFGCAAGGDVIDFLRRSERLSFQEAVRRLSDEDSSLVPRVERFSMDDGMILTAACAMYHEALLRTPAALKYLSERRIPMVIARRCRLGYADGHSLRTYLAERRLSFRRATEVGLLWQDGRESLAGRIVIPELRGGKCVWMIGRTLRVDRQPKYRGLALPKPILGYERVVGRPRVFVTEGAFDYLTGVSWGLSICALLGTRGGGATLAFLQQTRRVVIVFDNDKPGRAAAAEMAALLGERASVLNVPDEVKDLNDLGRLPDGRSIFFRLLRDLELSAPEPDRGGRTCGARNVIPTYRSSR
jgi:DNA primase